MAARFQEFCRMPYIWLMVIGLMIGLTVLFIAT
jgi:hypothetical protein